MHKVRDAKKSRDDTQALIAYINHKHIKDVRCEEDLPARHLVVPVLCTSALCTKQLHQYRFRIDFGN